MKKPRLDFQNLKLFTPISIEGLDFLASCDMLQMGILWMMDGETYTLKGDYRIGEA